MESGKWRRGALEEEEQLLREERGAVDFNPRGSRTKSPSSKSLVSGRWKVEKTQDLLEVEVEQFLEEEGDVDREENGDGLR